MGLKKIANQACVTDTDIHIRHLAEAITTTMEEAQSLPIKTKRKKHG